jgi:hypothetical protein
MKLVNHNRLEGNRTMPLKELDVMGKSKAIKILIMRPNH